MLLASAGTFTSCKDYDDDIKNLQEQINTVKTSLDELTTKVNSLGAGVKEFKYENGKLILVTDKDTNFEVELPACDGIKELEIKNGILYADDVEVGPIGGEGTTIEGDKVEVKDGILYINDEPQDLKDEVGSKVIVIDNNDGTYTLTVGSDSYVLPKATSSVSVDFFTYGSNRYFTNYSAEDNRTTGGIYWGTADKLLNPWGGLKTVEKGQLLVGQVKTVPVRVLPATFDLSAVENNLSLVNSLGEKAPVVIKAVSNNTEDPFMTDSRAADPKGLWSLQISMDETVTSENIGRIFANGDNTKNMMYALALDGKVLTGYDITVDTQTEKKTDAIVTYLSIEPVFTQGAYDVNPISQIPVGKSTTLYLTGHYSVDYVYDSYIEIKDTNKAGRYGISANGMTITTTSAAAQLPDGETVEAVLHMIDINGTQYEKTIQIGCADAETDAVEIAAQEFEIIPNYNKMIVDLADVFTSLTDTDADAISTGDGSKVVLWETTADAATVASTDGVVNNRASIKYYKTKEDALAGKNEVVLGAERESIKEIKFAVIDKSSFKSDAKAGVNNFTITLTDGKGNQLKKVTAKVTVTLPAFDDVIAPNTEYSTWDGDNFIARLNAVDFGGELVASISFNNAFISKKDANGNDFFDKDAIKLENGAGILSYSLTYTDPADGKVKTINQSNLSALIDKAAGKLTVTSLDVVVTAKFLGYETMTVSKEFVVNLKSIFEGGKVVYYGADNKPATSVNLAKTSDLIASGVIKDGKATGLIATFDTDNAAFVPVNAVTVGGIDLVTGTPTQGNDVKYSISLASGSQGSSSLSADGIKINNCTEGKSGKVVITFVDVLGIKTTSEIGYTKVAE